MCVQKNEIENDIFKRNCPTNPQSKKKKIYNLNCHDFQNQLENWPLIKSEHEKKTAKNSISIQAE